MASTQLGHAVNIAHFAFSFAASRAVAIAVQVTHQLCMQLLDYFYFINQKQ